MGHENGGKQRLAKRRHVQGMLDETDPGGYSHCGLTGGPVSLRVLPIGYQMALFVNHILPIRDILRLEAIYYVSTRYAPPHTNLVITASIINEF